MCDNNKYSPRGTCNLGHVASEFAQIRHDDQVKTLGECKPEHNFNWHQAQKHFYLQQQADEDLAQSMRNESEKMTLTPYHLPNVFKNKAHFDWYDFARAQRAAGHNIDPAIEHVQKKLFVPYRGHKSEREDIEECIKSLQNYLETLDDTD